MSEVKIDVESLELLDGGFISFINFSRFPLDNNSEDVSGKVQINANNIHFNTGGITSDTVLNETSGVLEINSESLLIENNSLISVSSSGNFNGGRMSLNVKDDILLLDSTVRANGEFGLGGFININSRGLYNVRSRLEAISGLSENSDGRVVISNSLDSGKIGVFEDEEFDFDEEIEFAQSCYMSDHSLNIPRTNTHEGLVIYPSDFLWMPATENLNPGNQYFDSRRTPIVEASGIYRSSNGSIMLIGTGAYGTVTNC